jgi:hypothetical protein
MQSQNEHHETQWSVGVGLTASSFFNAGEDIMPGQVDLGSGLMVSVNAKSGSFRARVSLNKELYSIDEKLWTPTPDASNSFDEKLKLSNLKIGVGYMTQISDKFEIGGYLDHGRLIGSVDNYLINTINIANFSNITGQLSELSASAVYNINDLVGVGLNVHYGIGRMEYRVDELNLANETLVYLFDESFDLFGADIQLMFTF